MYKHLDCEAIVREYMDSLRSGITVESQDDECVIVTPYLRPDGDYIELGAGVGQDGSPRLTDWGETMAFLHLNGLALSRPILLDVRRIAERYGVALTLNELEIPLGTAPPNLNPLQSLIQAIIDVAGLIEKRRPRAILQFDEVVEAEIIAQGRPYDDTYPVRGERQQHTIRFHVDGGLHLLVQTLTQNSETAARNTAERWFYHFTDILQYDPSWRCYALLDDRGGREAVWTRSAVTALQDLVRLVPWSQKENFLEAFSATS